MSVGIKEILWLCVYMTGGILYDCGRITHYSGRFYVNGGVLYHCGRLHITVGVFMLMGHFISLWAWGVFILWGHFI
jgi:hypothetical protein